MHSGGGGHFRADQMGAPAFALASFKVTVRCRRATFFVAQFVGVHGQAHTAAGVAPLGARFNKDAVEPLFFTLVTNGFRARNHQHANAFGDLLALDVLRGFAKVFNTTVGAAADKYGFDLDVGHLHARLQSHVVECGAHVGGRILRHGIQCGHFAGHVHAHTGTGSPGHLRSQIRYINGELMIKLRALVSVVLLPLCDRFIKRVPFGSVDTIAGGNIIEGNLIGRDQSGARAGFNRHIADRQAPFHRKRFDGFAAELKGTAGSAGGSDDADQLQDHILGRYIRLKFAGEFDFIIFRLFLTQRLRRQHVLHFGGADSKCDRTERAVCRGVRIAANHRHARQNNPLLRPDDMNHALAIVAERKKRHAGGGRVISQRVDLRLGDRIGNIHPVLVGRHVMVHGGERAVRTANFTAREAEAFEGLRTGHLVYQMAVNIQQHLAVTEFLDDVCIPNFVKQCFTHSGREYLPRRPPSSKRGNTDFNHGTH